MVLAVFKTKRLTINKISNKDIDKLIPILSDNVTMQYSATGVLTHEQVVQFIENCKQQYLETGFGYWAIVFEQTNELIGLCGLNQHTVDEIKYLHINYRLGSAYQGNGFATEVVGGLREYCKEIVNAKSVFAIIEPSNINSIKVVKRNGFGLIRQTLFKNRDANIYEAK